MIGNFNILLIDDDADDQAIIADGFQDYFVDCALEFANDGLDGLNRLMPEYPMPDLILLDLNMPRMNGFEFLTSIKSNARLSKLPVIVLTTSARSVDRFIVEQLGAAMIITKPNSMADLAVIVKDVQDFLFAN